ncbi:MAG: DUF2079 domain-containing protein [Candidatus Schekmanbacteria bacterium]|nr:DUF2079 domain-containing protein [Candidatus Schekmanbacteria bacterium]
MTIARYKILKFSPLLLLPAIFGLQNLYPSIAVAAIHPQIAVWRYITIPLSGFIVGLTAYLFIKDQEIKLNKAELLAEKYKTLIIVFLCVVFGAFYWGLSVLRYLTLHTHSGELGWYDSKVWNIARSSSIGAALITAATGYFQPLLIIHGLLYKLNDSPLLIQFLQTLVVLLGVIPLYLTAKEHFPEDLWCVCFVVLYLLYPPVEYNSAMEFHPDHLCIPLFLWAFYLIEKDRYRQALIAAGMGSLAKESLILSGAFFGLYLYLVKGRFRLGWVSFIFYSLLFCLVIFFVQPNLTTYYKNLGSVAHGSNFSYLIPSNSKGMADYFSNIVRGILTWKSKKMLLIIFLLAPFLCLPLIAWKRFIPALPALMIPVFSLYPFHSAVDLQYTSAVIPSIFIGLILAMSRIRKRFGQQRFTALFAWIFIMTLTFNIIHSPMPISPNFWDEKWSALWNLDNYRKSSRYAILQETINLIPSDPAVKIVAQYNINHARLAHRRDYRIFPDGWEEADYILLDTGEPIISIDVKFTPKEIYATDKYLRAAELMEEEYKKILAEIKHSGNYRILKENNGIVLFERIISFSGCHSRMPLSGIQF